MTQHTRSLFSLLCNWDSIGHNIHSHLRIDWFQACSFRFIVSLGRSSPVPSVVPPVSRSIAHRRSSSSCSVGHPRSLAIPLFSSPHSSSLHCPRPLLFILLVILLALEPCAGLLLGERKVVERGLRGGLHENVIEGEGLVHRIGAGLCLCSRGKSPYLTDSSICGTIHRQQPSHSVTYFSSLHSCAAPVLLPVIQTLDAVGAHGAAAI